MSAAESAGLHAYGRCRVLTILALLSAAFAQTGPTASAGRFTASVYGTWTLHSMNSVSASSQLMWIDNCYPTLGTNVQALFPLNTNGPLNILDPGNSEVITPSQVNSPRPSQFGDLTIGPYACSFVASFTKAHLNNIVITSATFGLQEAINDANKKGGGIVVLDDSWQGQTSIITATIKGFTSVTVEDTRSGDQLYNWNGTNYALGGGGNGSGLPLGFVDVTTLAGADVCLQIKAAITAGNRSLYIPKGNFAACAGVAGIGVAISTNSVTIQGAGWCNQLISPTCGATTLNFAAGVTGFDLTGGGITLTNFNLLSASSGAGTDDAIRNRGNPNTIDRVSSSHFGRSGIMTLGNVGGSGTNADSWHYNLTQAYLNYGDGYLWGASCTDNHQGVGTLMIASVNGGWGFNDLCGNGIKLDSPLVQNNAGGGYHLASGVTGFVSTNTYAESTAVSSFAIANGAIDNKIWFNSFGLPTTITNNGAANEIHFWTPASETGQNQLVLAPLPGATSPISYKFNSGVFANSDLGIFDATNSAWLLTYDPTTFWTFKKNVTIPNLTVSGTCTGCGSAGQTVNIQGSGVTAYTAVLGDANNAVTMSAAGVSTFTVPPNSSVAFPVGTTLTVIQLGGGQVSFVAGSGVTINTSATLGARTTYSVISVFQVAANVWVAGGDLL